MKLQFGLIALLMSQTLALPMDQNEKGNNSLLHSAGNSKLNFNLAKSALIEAAPKVATNFVYHHFKTGFCLAVS